MTCPATRVRRDCTASRRGHPSPSPKMGPKSTVAAISKIFCTPDATDCAITATHYGASWLAVGACIAERQHQSGDPVRVLQALVHHAVYGQRTRKMSEHDV